MTQMASRLFELLVRAGDPLRSSRLDGGMDAASQRSHARPLRRTPAVAGPLYLVVSPTPLGADTSPEIERLQIERWRQMTPAEKAAIVAGLTHAVYELARAGIRYRYPHASEREQFLRLAIVSLGPDLAAKAYPDIALTDLW